MRQVGHVAQAGGSVPLALLPPERGAFAHLRAGTMWGSRGADQSGVVGLQPLSAGALLMLAAAAQQRRALEQQGTLGSPRAATGLLQTYGPVASSRARQPATSYAAHAWTSTHLADKVLRPVVALQGKKVAAAKEAVVSGGGAARWRRAKAACCI